MRFGLTFSGDHAISLPQGLKEDLFRLTVEQSCALFSTVRRTRFTLDEDVFLMPYCYKT